MHKGWLIEMHIAGLRLIQVSVIESVLCGLVSIVLTPKWCSVSGLVLQESKDATIWRSVQLLSLRH